MENIQFNFICIAPNHIIHYSKALNIISPRPYNIIEEPNKSHNEQTLKKLCNVSDGSIGILL